MAIAQIDITIVIGVVPKYRARETNAVVSFTAVPR
jgi:hypothetical protein